MSRRRATLVALGAVTAMAVAACGGGGGAGGEARADAGVGGIANPSDVRGGTLRIANAGDWDSLDPGDMYYAYAWNFARLYGRTLVGFKAAPGTEGAELVPDLAESLGTSSADAKTWTYTLKQGIRFEDGTPITSKDVKYAVARSLDKATFPNGPTYFNDYLDLQGYTGPYENPNLDAFTAVETPDDRTIVFKLRTAFAGFDYLAGLINTSPVPQAKDTGTRYKEHVVSSGPYMFETNELGKRFTLVRNPSWDQATDPIRAALPDRIEVALNANADDVDNRLFSGDLDLSIEGTGVQPAAQGRVLADPTLRSNSDNGLVGFTWFTVLDDSVAPLDNVHCRKAVLLAADRTGYQRAYGGATGGDRATNLMSSVIPGAQQFDLYATPGGTGDVAKAKEELAQCGQPNGFTTSVAYRSERPKEKATAEALQQSLARTGITLEIKPYPAGDYAKLYAGKPDYSVANRLGLKIYGWQADWPDGFGFLSQIVDRRVIKPGGGNTNFGIRIPQLDAMIDQALGETDKAARDRIWTSVDRIVMDNASVLPGVWAKGLLYRPPNLTNVFLTGAWGMYEYTAIGTTRR